MNYSASDLKALIEPILTKDLAGQTYTSFAVDAKTFLTSKRFDLAFKLLYLEEKNRNAGFAQKVYKEHIRAFSLGKFTEPGSEEKNSIEKFFQAFDDTFESIKLDGFDSNKTLIPLSKNGLIANGAHRIASAIYLGKSVECVQIDTHDQVYDYKFFYDRKVARQDLDAVATKFVEHAENVYIAFIWPTAQGHNRETSKIIPNIVYKKEMRLNLNGAHNLLSQIYYDESWLGSVKKNFAGARVKVMECFKTFDPVRVVAFQAENLDQVLDIKEQIRRIFNVGKHSIHITDTKEEAMRVANVVFNDNSIHFLNHAKPNKYVDFHNKMTQCKQRLANDLVGVDDLVLGEDATLSIYGVKEAHKMQFLLADQSTHAETLVECGDDQLQDYDGLELAYNPRYHFHFNDLKFISFEQVYNRKVSRNSEADANDLKLLESLHEESHHSDIIDRWRQALYYGRAKLRQIVVNLLKTIGLLDFVKRLIRR